MSCKESDSGDNIHDSVLDVWLLKEVQSNDYVNPVTMETKSDLTFVVFC